MKMHNNDFKTLPPTFLLMKERGAATQSDAFSLFGAKPASKGSSINKEYTIV
jgi:hypothetical protein